MSKAPWFKFYVSDWLLSPSVRSMTAEQRGIYIQLLAEQWYSGNGLPSDEKILIQLAGCTSEEWVRSSDAVLPHFPAQRNGRLRNKKLYAMQKEAEALSEERSKLGKRGNAKKQELKEIHGRNCDSLATANKTQVSRDSDLDSDSDSEVDSDSEKAGGTLSRSNPPVSIYKSQSQSNPKAKSQSNGHGTVNESAKMLAIARGLANKLCLTATADNLRVIAEAIRTEAIASRCDEVQASVIIGQHADPNFGGKTPRFYFEDADWRAEPSYPASH